MASRGANKTKIDTFIAIYLTGKWKFCHKKKGNRHKKARYMIAIKDLIAIQSEKDQAAFISYVEGRNKRHDTRNVGLYKAFLKDEEEQILREIGSNAFGSLKKRLCDQLIEFTGGQLLAQELSQENEVLKLIALARKLFENNQIKTGHTLLKRAEKVALSLDLFAQLNEIYHLLIEHSHKIEGLDHGKLFTKLEKNNAQFIAEERLSVLYASMQKHFNSKLHGETAGSLESIYDKALQKFGISTELAFSFRALNQLCVLSDLFASQTKNYHGLDLFFEAKIPELQGSAKDNEKSLPYHLSLLYGMSSIYFRKNQLARSRAYLEQMFQQMKRYQKKYFIIWEARYVNLLALNLNFSGQPVKAKEVLIDCLENSSPNDTERPLLQLSLSMIYFQQGDLKEVKKIIASFQKRDIWYLRYLGNEWLFNYKAMEILLHFDLGNDQLAESRILSFQRIFARHSKGDKSNPLWPFLKLMKSALFYPEYISSPAFAEKVEDSIPWKGEEEDFFNRCFYAWLKAKMLKKPVYETTLDLLKKTQH